jgi:hypothetical protein
MGRLSSVMLPEIQGNSMAGNFARASASCAQLDSLLGLRPDTLKELLARRHLRGGSAAVA